MFSNHVVICNFPDHLNVVLFLALRKLRLQDHKKVVSVFVLKCGPLGKSWHFTWGQIDPALDKAGAIVE